MLNIFPIQYRVIIPNQQSSIPLHVPFTYQNQQFIFTQEDQTNIFTTRTYTINKWNPFGNQNVVNNGGLNQPYEFLPVASQLAEIIQIMMSAANEELKRRMQYLNQIFAPINWAKPINNYQLTFHYDQATTTADLKNYQRKSECTCTKNKVRFADNDTRDCGTFVDSRLILGYSSGTKDQETNVDPKLLTVSFPMSGANKTTELTVTISTQTVEQDTSTDHKDSEQNAKTSS